MFIKEVLAQTVSLTYLSSFLTQLQGILRLLVPLLFGIAIVLFFWGLVMFIWNAGDGEKRKEGRQLMIWGVIAIAVMASLYGLVAVLQSVFGLSSGATVRPPTLPF